LYDVGVQLFHGVVYLSA